MEKQQTRTTGIIAVIVFLALMLLPVCYAAYREFAARKSASRTPDTSASVNN